MAICRKGLKRFILYIFRWELSSPILALCLFFLEPVGTIWATIIANLIGGAIFFFVDKRIFKEGNDNAE